MLHLRHGDALVKLLLVDQRRKVRFIEVEHIGDTQRLERVRQFKIRADVKLRHAPDELAARQAHPHIVDHQSADDGIVRKKAFKCCPLVGQQETHRLPAAKAQLRHREVFAAAVVGAILREVHEVNGLLRAVRCGEGILFRLFLPEFIAPLVFEVER